MKAAPLLIHWHNDTAIYSADFERHGKGRLATAGGDHQVRVWQVENNGDERTITYLSTLSKHTASVNVVRWCPIGETLATAGDDGNILLWEPAEDARLRAFGDDNEDDKEHWRVKRAFRVPLEHEVYDLAWSPNGQFFITGSMDNIARIWNASTGNKVFDVAQHGNYVQGVAWDPLNEFVATQSSDKSVHVYMLKHKEDGEIAGAHHHNKFMRYEMSNPRRISSSSPAPPDFGNRPHSNSLGEALNSNAVGSPLPSAPGTPQSLALPMNPPPTSRSRRSSFGSSPAMRRSASPAPSIPLPAVMPSTSPGMNALGLRTLEYAGEGKYSSFFRRLNFSPDGSLLFTPSGQYRVQGTSEIVNTVYIYTRGGLNKPPAAYLPGHKKPSIAVKCSPVFYNIRGQVPTAPPKHITLDTSSAEGEIPLLPEPAVPSKPMDPPPISAPSPAASMTAPSPKAPSETDGTPTSQVLPGPSPVVDLPYRIIYAVATQDSLYLYDTQQKAPLCVVNNLHYAPFTDIAWSSDGLTVLVSSSDGFCSAITFAPNELGTPYTGPIPTMQNPLPAELQLAHLNHLTTTMIPQTASSSQQSTPAPTPVHTRPPTLTKQQSSSAMPASPASQFAQPAIVRPGSPARSMSVSSIATEMSVRPPSTAEAIQEGNGGGNILMHPTPSMGAVPSATALHSAPVPGNVPLWTPPETPLSQTGGAGDSFAGTKPITVGGSGIEPIKRTHSASSSVSGVVPSGALSGSGFAIRRDSEVSERPELSSYVDAGSATPAKRDAVGESGEDEARKKRRRVAPTTLGLVAAESPAAESVAGSMDPPSVPPSAEP